jgi:hypothetical protein
MSSRIAVSVSQRLPSMSRYAAEVSSQGDGKMVWELSDGHEMECH